VKFANAELDERRKELEEQTAELTKVNADKDKFFSIVAHDLRGPFQPLLGLSEFLAETAHNALPEDIQTMSDSIHRSAKNVYNLLENLLQWSRLQRGRIEHRPVRLNLMQVVELNVDLLTVNAMNKKVVLTNEVDSEVFVHADRNMLDTVIRNLISNALKFTPSGGKVSISTKTTDLESGSPLIEVSVADTGIGMNEEDVKKLFKIEVHHTTRGTQDERGSGLGLIICQEMVEKNGGRIWIESEEEKGTVVKFTVPLG